jgi:2,3-bisphosphoglycerate-independent phosphoglycerate mutase
MSGSVAEPRTPAAGTDRGERVFIVVLCGGADRPIARLGRRTPFEAAATPHLDELARRGTSGLLEVIDDATPPESDSGAMALLGYDPLRLYTGRGPLEALGMGFWDPDGSSAAFRVNFASWSPTTGRLDRRTSRDLSDDELSVLVREVLEQVTLDEPVSLRLTGFGRHRGILALTSRLVALSGRVTNTDPGFTASGPFGVPVAVPAATPLPCRPLETGDEAAAATARLVNRFVERSAEVLERSEVNRARRAAGRRPANVILARDGGHALPALQRFADRYGLQLSMYGQVPAEHGLAKLLGGRFTVASTARGQSDREFYGELVPALLRDSADVVFVHLKGPDEPGHDDRPGDKVAAIEDIDEHFVGPLVASLGPGDTLVVTCDHATPCEIGIHVPDRVPVVVAGSHSAADRTASFGERAAASGALAGWRACQLLPWLRAASAEAAPQ